MGLMPNRISLYISFLMYIIINRLLLFLYDEIHLKKYSYLFLFIFLLRKKKNLILTMSF
jgi:hypothetical protein